MRKSLVCLAIMFAGGANADARFSTGNAGPPGLISLEYAQVQIGDVAESDMRRLVFYSDRASRALQTLVEGADARSVVEQDKVNKSFRDAISRLADAGTRSGLSANQTADFLTQVIFDQFGQNFMQQVSALAGGLDFRTMFRNLSAVPAPRANTADSGAEFLDALTAASQGLDLTILSGAQPVENAGAVITIQTTQAGPQPLPNANAIERNIIERIRVVQGRWELTIQQGDSLSAIASAIYGDSLSYTTIYNANTDVLNSPNIIDVGTLLVLPQP